MCQAYYVYTINGREVNFDEWRVFRGPGIAQIHRGETRQLVKERVFKAIGIGFEIYFNDIGEIDKVFFIDELDEHDEMRCLFFASTLAQKNRLSLLVKYGIIVNNEIMKLMEQYNKVEEEMQRLRNKQSALSDKIGKIFAQSNREEKI